MNAREPDYWRSRHHAHGPFGAARSRAQFLFHNLVAHPLYAITETLDDFASWLHDRTAP